jgi:hypothetical protein
VTTIALHKYHEQIEQLLEDGAYHLAGKHCRQILQQHPLHVPTYRLLAKTSLESNQYREAKDLFQRILSADPNDYIAHVGLSIIYKEENVDAQALWHLERAYEIEPYNAAIQQELRVLYLDYVKQQENGRFPTFDLSPDATPPLTEGALARLYVRSELYEQAADLLRAILAKDEDRIDLRVLLTETLWRGGHRMEAVRTGLQVLEQLPNCIVANAVLADIWLRTGRIEEAQSYLRRVQALLLLDASQLAGESIACSAFRAEGAMSLPEEIVVEYLVGDMPLDDEMDSEAPVRRVAPALALGELASEDEDDAELYDWLEGLTGELVPTESMLAESAGLIEPAALDWTEEEEMAEDGETAVADFSADWLSEELEAEETAVAPSPPPADLMDQADFDWLEEAFAEPAQSQPAEPTFDQASLAADFAPDWLADLTPQEPDLLPMDELSTAGLFSDSDEPDLGLDEFDRDRKDDSGSLDWLSSLAQSSAEDEADAGEIDSSQFLLALPDEEDEADDEEVFEWRLTDELEPTTAPEPDDLFSLDSLSGEPPKAAPGDIPDWLMGSMQVEELEDESAALEAELTDEFADWVAVSNAGLVEEPKTPAWLAETAVDDADFDDSDSLPADLFSQPQPEPEPLQTGDLPDWLRGDALDLPDSGLLEQDSEADSAPDSEAESWFTEAAAAKEPPDDESPDLGKWVWPAAAAAVASAALDDIPDWMAADEDEETAETFAEAGVYVEEVVTDDKKERPTDPQEEAEVPQDSLEMGDSLDWLDDLDAPPIPLMEDSAPPDAAEELDDWLQADLGDLEDLDALADLFAEADSDSSFAAALPLGETAVDEADLDWLDALSTGKSAPEPIDETPTWQWPPEPAQPKADSLPNDELPTPYLPLLEDQPEPGELSLDALGETEDDFPDDLDDAMSWLEKLAGEPDAPVEELPSVAARLDKEDFPEPDPWDALYPTASLTAVDEPSEAGEEPGEEPEEAAFFDTWADAESDEELAEELDDLALFGALADEEEEGEALFAETAVAASQFALDAWDDDDDEEADEEADEGANTLPDHLTQPPAEAAAIAEALDDLDITLPEDPDEALAWLEQFAARYGVSSLEDLPAPTDTDPLGETPEAPAEQPEASAEETLLDALAALDEPETEPAPPLVEALAAEPDLFDEEFAAFDEEEPDLFGEKAEQPVSLAAEPDLFDEEFAAFDAALEALDEEPEAFGEEPEPPAVELDEDEEPDEEPLETLLASGVAVAAAGLIVEELDEFDLSAPDDPDEAMAWLEQLAARQGAPLDELPSVTSLESFDEDLEAFDAELEAFDAEAEAFAVEAEASYAELEALDEAPLIQELADVPADEALTAIADMAELAAEDLDEFNLAAPDDLDAAMAWLEQLAARQGASLDELPSISEDAEVAPEPDLFAEESAEISASLFAFAKEEEEETEEEAEAFATEPLIEAFADESDEETEILAAAATGLVVEALDDFDLNVPDDPDEAMAWLEQLAARQGAPLDELPSVSGIEALDEAFETFDDKLSFDDELLFDEEMDLFAQEPAVETPAEVASEEALAAVFESLDSPAGALAEAFDDFDLAVPEDPDEAMAWLERLAARQGAPLDELPSIDDKSPLVEAATALEAIDEAWDFQEEDLPELEALPEAADEVVDALAAAPDDLDEAMAWLEQLAARQGAPLDELPSIDDQSPLVEAAAAATALEAVDEAWDFQEEELSELDALPEGADEVVDALAAAPDDLDEAMAWLEQLAARQGAPLDELPSIDDKSPLVEAAASATALEAVDEAWDFQEEELLELDALPEATDEAVDALAAAPDDLDEAMAWLEQLAARQGAPLDELPSVSEEDWEADWEIEAPAPTPEPAADDWLDLPVEEEVAPPTPAPVSQALLSELDWLAETSGATDESLSDLAEIEVDDDELAAALDLLEDLAHLPIAKQAAEPPTEPVAEPTAVPVAEPVALDLEEDYWLEDTSPEALMESLRAAEAELPPVPAMRDEVGLADDLAFDVSLFDEIPDDPEAAMAWLERLAARQGAPVDELPSVGVDEAASLREAGLAAIAAEEREAEAERVREEEITAEVDLELDEWETAVSETAEMPENIEDMMAWLEQLAARQGASLDELPTVTDLDQDIITPSWITAQMEAPVAPEPPAVKSQPADYFAAEEPESIFAELGLGNLSSEELDQEFDVIDDSLPDWLIVEDESTSVRVLGDTDWLDALPEPDLEGWLAAEEEATAKGPATTSYDPAELPLRIAGDTYPLPEIDTGPLTDSKSGLESAATTAYDDDDLALDLDFGLPGSELDQARLRSAQQALASGNFDVALSDYAALVEAGGGLTTVIANLENATGQYRDRPLLRRLLGDAYMRNGQLQKALETYRQALDQL